MDFSLQTVHPDKAHRELMRTRAIELRAKGWSYRKIGADLGINHETARTHVMGAIEDLREQRLDDTHEARLLELHRQDMLWEKGWDALEANMGDAARVAALISVLTRVSERRASLLGLDVTRYLPMVPRPGYVADTDLGRLDVAELHQYEALAMKAQGLDPKPFGLMPSAEVFEETPPPEG